MAVASLRYRPNAILAEEFKFGFVVFAGDPHEYHHWLFRTDLKLKTSKQDEVARAMRDVSDNLRGDAFAVAMG